MQMCLNEFNADNNDKLSDSVTRLSAQEAQCHRSREEEWRSRVREQSSEMRGEAAEKHPVVPFAHVQLGISLMALA